MALKDEVHVASCMVLVYLLDVFRCCDHPCLLGLVNKLTLEKDRPTPRVTLSIW